MWEILPKRWKPGRERRSVSGETEICIIEYRWLGWYNRNILQT